MAPWYARAKARLASDICSPKKPRLGFSSGANLVMFDFIYGNDPTRGGYYSRNREFLAEASPLESCLIEDPIQVMFTGGVVPMREAEAALRNVPFGQEFALAVTVYAAKDFSMIDVMLPSVSKGVALAEWAGLRGIAPLEILAIGAHHNDLEMLSFAGVPVVMGNSVPELKIRGWAITGSNDEDGVAAAIEQYALQTAGEWQ